MGNSEAHCYPIIGTLYALLASKCKCMYFHNMSIIPHCNSINLPSSFFSSLLLSLSLLTWPCDDDSTATISYIIIVISLCISTRTLYTHYNVAAEAIPMSGLHLKFAWQNPHTHSQSHPCIPWAHKIDIAHCSDVFTTCHPSRRRPPLLP